MATASENFVQQLYVAYYGRPADSAGLQYWADRADEEGQGAIIKAFGESQEFQDSYGDLSNEELVNNLYQQLFSRDADDAGLEYYTGVLESGDKTLSEIALTISNAAQGSDSVVLNTKVQAANYYTNTIADANYDVDSAKDLLASIDEVNTGADFDNVVDQVDNAQDISGVAANYQAVQAAEAAQATAEDNLADALADLDDSELDYDAAATGGNADGDVDLDDVQAYVTNAQNALNTAVSQNGTDAELAQDVEDAKDAIRAVDGTFDADGNPASAGGSLSAGDLLDNYEDAVVAYEADVEADGTSVDLAKSLNASVAAYLANNDDIDTDSTGTADELATLQTAAQDYIDGNSDEATFLNAVNTAQAQIFSGKDDASILEDGANGDSIETLVTTLDERDELADDVADTSGALTTAASAEFTALQTAQAAVETRADARADLEEAQGDLSSLKELQTAVTEAETAVSDAEDALGYETVEISGTSALGTADDELFVFDNEASQSVSIDLDSNDAIYLGAGYTLGDADNVNDSQLEVFLDDSSGNVVATVENFADGTDTSNVELTLTGVTSIDDVNFNADNGTITIA
jgi:hypothetical protein